MTERDDLADMKAIMSKIDDATLNSRGKVKESVPYTHRDLGGCFFFIPRINGLSLMTIEVEPDWVGLGEEHLAEWWRATKHMDTKIVEAYFIEKPANWRP